VVEEMEEKVVGEEVVAVEEDQEVHRQHRHFHQMLWFQYL
jgi:hypothetical protein